MVAKPWKRLLGFGYTGSITTPYFTTAKTKSIDILVEKIEELEEGLK